MAERWVDIAIADYGTPELAGRAMRSISENFGVGYTVSLIDAKAQGLSYAQAINRGLRRAAPAPYVLALNADTECLADQSPILDLFEAHPVVAVIGPRQTTSSGLVTHAGILGEEPHRTHRAWMKPIEAVERLVDEPLLDVGTVAGSVMYARRAEWERQGGFDERLPHYYEETLFNARARKAGHRVCYCGLPEVAWIHEWARSPVTEQWLSERFVESRRVFSDICEAEALPP